MNILILILIHEMDDNSKTARPTNKETAMPQLVTVHACPPKAVGSHDPVTNQSKFSKIMFSQNTPGVF